MHALRRFRRATGLLCTLPLLAGCFAYETTVRLSPDGSGTVEQEIVLTRMMAEMLRAANEEAEEEGIDVCEELDLGEGARLVSAEPIEETERMGCRQVYAFTDVNALRLKPGPAEGLQDELGDGNGTPAAPEEPITFSFQPGSPATLVIRMPERETEGDEEDDEGVAEGPELDAEADAAGRAMALAMMREMLRDSRFSVRLVLDGDIVETDASHRDGNRITLIDLDFDALLEDPEALERLMGIEDPSSEQANALLAELPGVRFETREEVTVRFR